MRWLLLLLAIFVAMIVTVVVSRMQDESFATEVARCVVEEYPRSENPLSVRDYCNAKVRLRREMH